MTAGFIRFLLTYKQTFIAIKLSANGILAPAITGQRYSVKKRPCLNAVRGSHHLPLGSMV